MMKTDVTMRNKTKNKERNFSPGNKEGKRNIFCPHYSECLDFVVEKQWLSWNCKSCEHRLNEAGKTEILAGREDSIPYYEVRMPF